MKNGTAIAALALTTASPALSASKSLSSVAELTTDPATLIRADDYPAEAMRAGAGGTVRAALDIDAQGRVFNCRILSSSNVVVLDVKTCELLQSRAKFKPALDRDGKPIVGTYARNIVWRLPVQSDVTQPEQGDGPVPTPLTDPATWFQADDYPANAYKAGEQGAIVLAMRVDATGKVSGCSVDAEGYQLLAIGTCEVAKAHGQFRPARDPRGKAIASSYRRRVVWKLPDTPLDLTGGRHLISETVRTYRVDSTGKIVGCTIEKPEEMRGICEVPSSATLGNALAKNGLPVGGTITRSQTTWIDPD